MEVEGTLCGDRPLSAPCPAGCLFSDRRQAPVFLTSQLEVCFMSTAELIARAALRRQTGERANYAKLSPDHGRVLATGVGADVFRERIDLAIGVVVVYRSAHQRRKAATIHIDPSPGRVRRRAVDLLLT